MNPVTESTMAHETLVEDRTRDHVTSPVVHAPLEHASPKGSILGRVMKALMMVVVVAGVAIFAMYKLHVNIPALHTAQLYATIDTAGERAEHWKAYFSRQYESRFGKHEAAAEGGESQGEEHRIVITKPMEKDVTITQDYVCQIKSQRHIDICALEGGYLTAIPIREGQAVHTGQLMFEINSTLYKARLEAEKAERDLAQLEYNNTKRLFDRGGVSDNEVKLFGAKLAKAQAKVDLAQAEFNFTTITAPFDGIVDRLHDFQGSLIKEGDMLTTLSDNSVMWAYFNVPEKRYLEYKAETGQNQQSPDIELVLANHSNFPHIGKIGAIESNFNNENGNIAFRADFPNPDRLLRHGQTGTVLINRLLRGALVIPQRAVFENLAKRYVYVVGADHVVHQQVVEIDHELEDIYVIKHGLTVKDQIVLEGIRQVHDGAKVEYEYRSPEEAMKNMKSHAE